MTLAALQQMHVDRMAAYITGHPMGGGRGFILRPYQNTTPADISNQPLIQAVPDKCWDNVKLAEAAGLGEPVYGWAFWPLYLEDYSVYMAQYHAVIKDAEGVLIDVSPQPDLYANGTIHFMADRRLGFDYASIPLRQPPALCLNHAIAGTGTDAFRWCGFEKINNEIALVPLPLVEGAPDNYGLLKM